jgi:3-oxoadipate enol-lactonase
MDRPGRTLLRSAALGWVAWRLFGPPVRPRTTGVQERPPTAAGRTVVVGRHEFLVRELGSPDAPVLVLIHGWVYGSVPTWHRVIERLAERYRVIAIDHRNHGKADRVQGRYTIEQAADEVAGVMAALGLRQANVLGYSMGGMIAQSIVRRHPGTVARLVLAATAAYPIPERRLMTRLTFLLARAAGRTGSPIGARLGYHYLLTVGAVERRYSAWLWDTVVDRDINLYFEGGWAIVNFDARSWVGKLAVPALVVIPTEDQLIPPSAQYELASLLPSAGVVELVGGRHEAVMTHPDDFVKAIEGFIG